MHPACLSSHLSPACCHTGTSLLPLLLLLHAGALPTITSAWAGVAEAECRAAAHAAEDAYCHAFNAKASPASPNPHPDVPAGSFGVHIMALRPILSVLLCNLHSRG